MIPTTPYDTEISWLRFPPELQLMILNYLVESAELESQASVYAAVCRQWQEFFEPVLFKRLILHQSDIKKFGDIVQGERVAFVKWVWLRLELPAYGCNDCTKPGSSEERQDHNKLFTNAVWDLFAILRHLGDTALWWDHARAECSFSE